MPVIQNHRREKSVRILKQGCMYHLPVPILQNKLAVFPVSLTSLLVGECKFSQEGGRSNVCYSEVGKRAAVLSRV